MGKGSIGLGTLMVIVGLILIAAIVGYVIITSNGQLQQKAIETHTLAKKSLTKSIYIKEISATNGLNGQVDQFRVLIKLLPGSDPVRLDRMAITMTKDDLTQTLIYRNGSCVRNETTGYYTIT